MVGFCFLFFGNERNFSGVSCRVQNLIKGQKSKNPIIKKMCKMHKIKTLPLGTLHKNQKIQKNCKKPLDKSKMVWYNVGAEANRLGTK